MSIRTAFFAAGLLWPVFLSWPTHAQVPISIVISPDIPTDLPPLPQGRAHHTLKEAAIFAWQQFIGVTWPAKNQDGGANTRDQPDTSGTLKYGDKGPSGHVVWETFRHKAEIFPGLGEPNGFSNSSLPDFGYDALPKYIYGSGEIGPAMGQAVPAVPPYDNLDEVDEIQLCDMNAGIGKPSPRILFQAKANRILYAYIAQNGLFNQPTRKPGEMRANAVFNLTQDDPSTFKKPNVELPASDPDQARLGAMEIKSAWRRLNVDPSSPFFDNPKRFYTARVRRYIDENLGTPNARRVFIDSGDSETWGLVALHVIQKTKSSPNFVYTSFGQVDNIRAADGTLVEEPDGTVKQQFRKVEPFTPPLTISVSRPPLGGADATPQNVAAGPGSFDINSPQLNIRNKVPFIQGLPQPIGINRRLFSIPAEIVGVNAAAQEAIRKSNQDAVWQYYKLVNVQSRTLESFVDRSQVDALSDDLRASYYMANIVVESNAPLQRFSGMLSPAESDAQPPGYGAAGNSDYALFDRPGAFAPNNPIQLPFMKNSRVSNTFVPRIPRADGESYWQKLNLGGCVGCHGGQGETVGGDFSVIVARGRVVSPEAPELEEGQIGAFTAAGSTQSIEQLNAYIRKLNLSTIRNEAVLYGR